MNRTVSIILAAILMTGLAMPVLAASGPELDSIVEGVAGYILGAVQKPLVGTAGGEWAVLGLARSGCEVPDEYYDGYYRAVEEYVRESGGVISSASYTEYSRIILSLTAAGYDPRNVAGYDLTAPLEDIDRVSRQGVNSLIYALLALDSADYVSGRREIFIDEILRRQLTGGGWNLAGGSTSYSENPAMDPDVTGMALQALAKYQHIEKVREATDRALARLSGAQRDNGGFIGWEEENIESSVQVLVALCELGVDAGDARFVKSGNTIIDNILTYMNDDFSFNHTRDSSDNNQMSTEQALYSLAAAKRAADGKNSLYRMKDAVSRGESPGINVSRPAGAGLAGKDRDVNYVPELYLNKTFSDIQGHANQAGIEALAARGIVNGRDESTFDPDATMTRAEFAAIIVRSLGIVRFAQPQTHKSFFSDVTESDWFCGSVYTAAAYGIVKGVSDSAFNPRSDISRQEAAVMVARAAKLCGLDTDRNEAGVRNTLAQFGDYRTVESWALEALAFCYDAGILDDSVLDIGPGVAILRCEIADMLYRLLQKANLISESE